MDKWDSEAIKKMRQPGDSEIVVCSKTEIELYYVTKKGTQMLLESFGRCCECEEEFHSSCLVLSKESYSSEWPIQYAGAYCKECYYADDELKVEPELDELSEDDLETEEG